MQFLNEHPERKKNQRVSLEDLEEVLSDHIIFTRQPALKTKKV